MLAFLMNLDFAGSPLADIGDVLHFSSESISTPSFSTETLTYSTFDSTETLTYSTFDDEDFD